MQNDPNGATGEAAPESRLTGNVRSLFGELESRARKVRCLADIVGESLTDHIESIGDEAEPAWRLPLVEGARVQYVSLIAVDEVDRLLADLDAAHVFFRRNENASAGPDPKSDQFLAAIKAYQAETDAVNAQLDDISDEDFQTENETILDRLFCRENRTPPPVTTMEGAVAGVRQVFAEKPFCDTVAEKLLRAVLAYLEGRASA